MLRLRICLVIYLLSLAAVCSAQKVTVTPFQADGIYNFGEKAGWTVKRTGKTKPLKYAIKENNLEVIKEGKLDFSNGDAKIEIAHEKPAMLFLEISADDGKTTLDVIAGAAVEPTELQPCVPRPNDFDRFWQEKIAELERVPANPVLTPGESGRPDIEYGLITMDHVDGGKIHGQYAKPKKLGKKPALLIFQWASPPYPLDKSWVLGHAAQGWLVINIEPHDVLPTEPQEYYDNLPDEIQHYESIGNDDRDKSYFLRMYLAAYRAVDYAASHPEWDGKTLACYGTSMGGQQSLCVAGLHPKITHVMVNVPAGCDTNGPHCGRQASYPNFPADDPQVMKTAQYFDVVNFAPKITATTLIALGFVDETSAPAGIWTAYNLIPGKKEIVPLIDAPHNHLATPEQLEPWNKESARWLATLTEGKPLEVVPIYDPQANSKKHPAIEKTDANSRLAHEQMVAKAKQGGIDLYFLGDSITRRWGARDAACKPLLENWRKNFFGWNAGNFGWGGDRTENILWRIQNGELEGVNPKVIVLLAGTNNVNGQAGNEEKVKEVVDGIRAIIDTCQEKSPEATIVLTAIMQRNDNNSAAMPTIDEINERLAKLADGKRVRFLNVNDKLADGEGKLSEGMTDDGVHLTVEGYQVWADGLKPILTELMGPPAETDHAPAPTGDPSAG
jgi:cephalosporin-C deacetylase-like acetyl esterase/lysophospholipase L1-like esterase